MRFDRHNISADLDVRFFLEAGDASWAPIKAAELRSGVDEMRIVGTEVVSSECRSSFCRLELTHEDGVTAREFVSSFHDRSEFSKHNCFAYAVDDDGTEMVLYVSRGPGPLPFAELPSIGTP